MNKYKEYYQIMLNLKINYVAIFYNLDTVATTINANSPTEFNNYVNTSKQIISIKQKNVSPISTKQLVRMANVVIFNTYMPHTIKIPLGAMPKLTLGKFFGM
jgi:hypothetical protein